MPIAIALQTALADAIGVRMVFMLGGILAVVTTLIGLTFREIRALDLSAATTMLANTNWREGKKR
jgi:hypothetical protein